MKKQFGEFGRNLLYQLNWLSNKSVSDAQVAPLNASTSPNAPASSIAHPPAPPSRTAKRRRRPSRLAASSRQQSPSNRWRWSYLWLGAFCVAGGMGTGAFLWLTSLPPAPDCQKLVATSSEMERLYCAREAAQSGRLTDLLAGLELVKGWSADQPLYADAQELISDWSSSLFTFARTKVEQGNLSEALKLVQHIPPASKNYGDVQAAIAQWQAEWQKGEAIYRSAQAALKHQKWNEASAQLPILGNLNYTYWRRHQVIELTRQILLEREAWQTLREARKLATNAKPEQLGEAIALVQQIDPKTYTWSGAAVSLKTWSQVLVTVSMNRWQQGDLTGAIALAQRIPRDQDIPVAARDLVQFSYATKLATDGTEQFQPSLGQLWQLMEALAAVRQIQPGSPFYQVAQTNIQRWEQQVQDLTQLQYANMTAGLGNQVAFDLAIDQAKQIGTDRPRRLQAQSLIAHWQQQMERIEDQPYLLYARELAKPGTIPALRQAILAAQRVPMGRALRLEAQTAIAQWRGRIETIEDQPFLNRALALAKQGKLRDAIQAAAKIRPGRALSAEAQAAIADWRAQILAAQIAEDRKILNEASGLAASTRLTQAIDVASQIVPGRPLYGEAQSAIAQWSAERDAIWESWADQDQQAAESYDDGYDQGGYTDEGTADSPQ